MMACVGILRIRPLIPMVTALTLSGCAASSSSLSPDGRGGKKDPYGTVEQGAEVRLVFKDQQVLIGTYEGFREEPDRSYEDRFGAAVAEDSTLQGAPMLGDTVRVTVDRAHPTVHVGAFAGMGAPRWPGVYVDEPQSGTQFYSASRMVAFEHGDGTPIGFGPLHRAVLTGRIPSKQESNERWISIRTDLGLVEVNAHEIDFVELPQEQQATTGLKTFGAVLAVAVAAVLVISVAQGYEKWKDDWGTKR